MKNRTKGLLYLAVIGVATLFTACGDDDGASVPISLSFTNASLGLSESVEVGITFSRPAEAAGEVVLQILAPELQYGTASDYYTTPEAVNGEINISYEAGAESASFTVFAGSALNILQDKVITLTLTNSNGFTLGEEVSATVTVAENFVAASGRLTMDAGGPGFPKHAFVDLSKQNASTVEKNTWDLAFHNDGFHVTLNATTQVMARSISKTDITAVTAADTTGFGAEMVVGFNSTLAARDWVDYSSGDLTNTAIEEISSNADNNLVYIIKRNGTEENWKKIKISQSGSNYSIQYADINSSTFTEVVVEKTTDYNSVFFSLDNGVIDFEPAKLRWDFMYGSYVTFSTFGQPIPYSFSDFIIINRESTSVATVMIDETTTFENFDVSAVSSLTFSTDLDAIGSTWRGVFPPATRSDRFYVLKDSENNYYKIEFESLTNGDGDRGYVTFEFELL